MMEIVRNGQKTTGISLTQKQRAQHQKQSEKRNTSSMAAYNEDDYCLAQGGGRYNAKSLDMMYLLAQICLLNHCSCKGKVLRNMTNLGFWPSLR